MNVKLIIMRFTLLGIFVLAILVLSSCNKNDGDLNNENLTDAQLIEAIQKADKQNIDVSDLPDPSMATLENDYTRDFIDAAKLAPGLGYEVDLRKQEGMEAGKLSNAYFDLSGREIRGDNSGDEERECFELILPVTYTMPDGSSITIETEEDWMLLRNWYEENPGYDEEPVLQYPVDILWFDGNIQTINNEEEMLLAIASCEEMGGGE